MTTEHRPDGWWVVNTPEGVEPMGPYRTRQEAEDDRRGVERSLRLLEA